MRRYELMLLLRPDLEDDKLQAAVEKVTRAIVNGGGSLSKVSPWGKRRLAYPIQHLREASYFLIHFDIEPSAVREIERGMLISEEILRYLVTVIEDRGPAPEELEPAVEPRAEREQREEQEQEEESQEKPAARKAKPASDTAGRDEPADATEGAAEERTAAEADGGDAERTAAEADGGDAERTAAEGDEPAEQAGEEAEPAEAKG